MYLAGLGGLAAAGALLAHHRRRALVVAEVIAFAAVAVGAGAQGRRVPEREVEAILDLVERPDRHLVCETRAAARYCVYPAYRGWIDRWEATLERVVQRVPAEGRRPLAVRQFFEGWQLAIVNVVDPLRYYQRFESLSHETGDGEGATGRPEIGVGMLWGRGPEADTAHYGLALSAAQRLVGLPIEMTTAPRRYQPADIEFFENNPDYRPWPGAETGAPRPGVGDPYTRTVACTAEGQAREVVSLWLAFQATVGDRPPAERVRDAGNLYSGYGYLAAEETVQWSDPGRALALEMLARPNHDIAPIISARWAPWLDPTTPASELASAFGLTTPPSTPPAPAFVFDDYVSDGATESVKVRREIPPMDRIAEPCG